MVKLLKNNENYPIQVALVVKNPPANAGDIRDAGSIPGSGRSPGGRRGYTLRPREFHGQRSLLGFQYTVSQSRTWLKWLNVHIPFTTVSKIFKTEFMQGREKPAQWKLQDFVERIQKTHNKWKGFQCSRTGRFTIVKASTPCKLIYRYNSITLKIP